MAEPRAFVCGFPIDHSRSPLIHNHWLQTMGLEGSYERIAVPRGGLTDLLQSVRVGAFTGGNVTIPHKEAAFAAVDRHDAAAAAIGAVNTLWMDGDTLVGGNTDAYGFAANLDDQLPGWDDNGPALVIGAGGAARAVVHALLERGIRDIRIANRTLERATALATHFALTPTAYAFTAIDQAARDAGLIVNTTALGMKGQGRIPLDFQALRPDAILSDIVYVPLETPFLAEGRRQGFRTSDGLGMLLHQAVPGFEHWFGRRPQVDAALRSLIEADVERAA